MNEKKKILMADGALLLAAACWGGGFVAGDIAAERFMPFFIMAVRFIGAGVFMGIVFRRSVKNSSKADWKAGAILGTMIFLSQPIQIIALRYTTPSKQAFLITSYVIIVPFISWFIMKKRPQIKAFGAGILALLGIGLISLDGALQIQLGDGLTLFFSLLYSFVIVATGIFAKRVDPLAMSFYQYLTTGLLSLIAVLVLGGIPGEISAEGALAIGYLLFINTVVAYTLQNVAQRYTSDTHSAVLISTESVIGYFCGVVLYDDPFTPRVLLGGMIVFGAVLLSVVNWGEILNGRKT